MRARAADDRCRRRGREVHDLERGASETEGDVAEVGGDVVAKVRCEELWCQVGWGGGVEREVGGRRAG